MVFATSATSVSPRGEAIRMMRFQSAFSGAANSVACGVTMAPGHTALMRRRSAVNSMASARVGPTKPCLAAQ